MASDGLGRFEGFPVTGCGIEIPNAGGGLRDALKVSPVLLKQGTLVHVILECEVAKLRFEPVDRDEPTGPQRRVHVLTTTDAAIIDGDALELVKAQLQAQRARIRKANEIEGQQSIEVDG